MRDIPKVALLVSTARGFGRDLLHGIARYSRLHGPWSFHIAPGDFKQAVPEMKQWGGRGISVEDVVEHAAVSRRNLETRFRDTMGRTILDEIQLVRLERARRLLVETSYPMSKVAELTGFGSAGHFIQFFQKRLGKTPRKYRIDLSR